MDTNMKQVIILDHERMQRAKTAIVMTATKQDRYRIGVDWHRVGGSDWRHGQPVDEVNHFGRHSTEVGDRLIVKRIDGVILAHIQVLDILMADPASFTPADLAALGYASQAEYQADWGEVFGSKVWLMHIIHLTPRAELAKIQQ